MENKLTSETPNFRTQILQCKDCQADFILTDSEMLYYYRKNLNFPVRCRECRQARRAQGLTTAEGSVQGGDCHGS
jgi:hypothetical protein